VNGCAVPRRDSVATAHLEARAATACPLCGGPNRCVPARSGSFAEACWCEAVSFDPAVLERVPAASRGSACICAACAGVVLPRS
jgi:hypothetical protein